MEKLLSFIIIFVLMVLQTNAQDINFPTELLGYRAKPASPLSGEVKTVLTISYKGKDVLNTTVEAYSPEKKKQEFVFQNADIEIHTKQMVSLARKDIYIYDSKSGNLSKILFYKATGEFLDQTTFSYDNKGRLFEEIGYSNDNKILSKKTFVYDSEKREVTATHITYYKEKASRPQKIVLAYNGKGQWIKKMTFDKYGNREDIILLEYDDKGNLIKEDWGSFSYTYEYKFDKRGNWIEKIEIYSQLDDSREPTYRESMRVYRVITYYTDAKQ